MFQFKNLGSGSERDKQNLSWPLCVCMLPYVRYVGKRDLLEGQRQKSLFALSLKRCRANMPLCSVPPLRFTQFTCVHRGGVE